MSYTKSSHYYKERIRKAAAGNDVAFFQSMIIQAVQKKDMMTHEEIAVLKSRFGINDNGIIDDLKTISSKLKVCPETVRNIELKAIAKVMRFINC